MLARPIAHGGVLFLYVERRRIMRVVSSYFADGHPNHKGARLGKVRNEMISVPPCIARQQASLGELGAARALRNDSRTGVNCI